MESRVGKETIAEFRKRGGRQRHSLTEGLTQDSGRRVVTGARSEQAVRQDLSRKDWGRPVFLRILDRLEEIIIASLMAAATLMIFVAVVHRYGTGVPFLYPYFIQIHISWAQELCIYMFVWMAKFGAAYGVRTGIHVGVDVLVNQLRPSPAQQGGAVRPVLRRAVHLRRRHHGPEVRHGALRTPIRCRPISRRRAGSCSPPCRPAPT